MSHNPDLESFKDVDPAAGNTRPRPRQTNSNVAGIGKERFYKPFNHGMWWVRPGAHFLARMMAVRHVEAVRYYSVHRFADKSVVPEKIRKWADQRMYLSTFDPDAGPDLPMGTKFIPDSRWVVDPGKAFIQAGAVKVLLVRGASDDLWKLGDYTDFHPFPGFPWPDGGTLENMQFVAETFIAQTLSDPLGAHLRREVLQKVKSKDRTLRARDAYLMPLFSLVWMEYAPHQKAGYSGKMTRPDRPERKPSKGEVSIRQGLSWVECSASPASGSYVTWLNYQRYAFDVWRLCGDCGRAHGDEYTWEDHPRLEISGAFTCPSCGEVPRDPETGDLMDNHFVAGLDDQTLMNLTQSPVHCPTCDSSVNPKLEVRCSCCGEGRPTQLDEVLTKVGVYESGGTRVFEFHAVKVPKAPWHIPWTQHSFYAPSKARAQNIPSNLEEAFPAKVHLPELDGFLLLKPDDQVQLIGTDLFDALGHRAEVRR